MRSIPNRGRRQECLRLRGEGVENALKIAVETEKLYFNMTREEMIRRSYDVLSDYVIALARMVDNNAPEDEIEQTKKEMVALRKALEPYENEFCEMIQKEMKEEKNNGKH